MLQNITKNNYLLDKNQSELQFKFENIKHLLTVFCLIIFTSVYMCHISFNNNQCLSVF